MLYWVFMNIISVLPGLPFRIYLAFLARERLIDIYRANGFLISPVWGADRAIQLWWHGRGFYVGHFQAQCHRGHCHVTCALVMAPGTISWNIRNHIHPFRYLDRGVNQVIELLLQRLRDCGPLEDKQTESQYAEAGC